MEKVTTVNVYPGIGDILWTFQKLQGLFPVLDINISSAGVRRSENFVKMIEGVRNVSYRNITRPMIRAKTVHDVNLRDYEGKDFFLEANTWLESGKRIEDWMPKTENFVKDVKLKPMPTHPFVNTLQKRNNETYIGIYTSNIANNKRNGMTPELWAQYISEISSSHENPQIFIIGAEYDKDMALKVKQILNSKHKIHSMITIGYEIHETIGLLKKLDLIVGFPSGICILSNMFKIPNVMFMTAHLKKMHLTWVDKDLIENDKCFHVQFSDHKNLVNYVNKLNLK